MRVSDPGYWPLIKTAFPAALFRSARCQGTGQATAGSRETRRPVSSVKTGPITAFRLLPLLLWALVSCQSNQDYMTIPVFERRLNLSGLEAVATRYLNEHPGDFYRFHRILTAADDALGKHEWITRSAVMGWIRRNMEKEGLDLDMPVYRFIKTVYLSGWEESTLEPIDLSEREYLYDLISAVMGGMHLCTTCSTAREPD